MSFSELSFSIFYSLHHTLFHSVWMNQTGELFNLNLSLITTDRIRSGWGAASMEEAH